MMSALLAVISNHKGKYYVSFVAADGDRDPNPKVAIVGPFSRAEKAQRQGEKWVRLGNEAIEKNEPFTLPDLIQFPATSEPTSRMGSVRLFASRACGAS